MYMDEVPKETSCVRVTCERRFEIKDPKPAPITLYDYYMPSEFVWYGCIGSERIIIFSL